MPVGGNALVILNTELRIRDPFFPELLEYIPFIDAGQLWTREQGTNKINLDRLIVTPRFRRPVLLAGGAHSGECGVQSLASEPDRPGVLGGHRRHADRQCAVALRYAAGGAAGADSVVRRPKADQDHRGLPGRLRTFQIVEFFNQFVFTISIGASF